MFGGGRKRTLANTVGLDWNVTTGGGKSFNSFVRQTHAQTDKYTHIQCENRLSDL